MKCIKFLSLSLFLMGNALYAMEGVDRNDPLTWPRLKTINQAVEQLKKTLFEKGDPSVIQKTLNEIKINIRNFTGPAEAYYVWHDIFAPNKASLVGNAESAARVVDLQAQQLVKRNKAIPAELQAQHANARTNIHLIKDFLYPLERALGHGHPDEMVEAARRNK